MTHVLIQTVTMTKLIKSLQLYWCCFQTIYYLRILLASQNNGIIYELSNKEYLIWRSGWHSLEWRNMSNPKKIFQLCAANISHGYKYDVEHWGHSLAQFISQHLLIWPGLRKPIEINQSRIRTSRKIRSGSNRDEKLELNPTINKLINKSQNIWNIITLLQLW